MMTFPDELESLLLSLINTNERLASALNAHHQPFTCREKTLLQAYGVQCYLGIAVVDSVSNHLS